MASEMRPAAALSNGPLLAARRALVVDDNNDSADSLAMLLQLMGAEVRVAYSGAAALEALAAHLPSVMFVDIGMPEIDGYEVARRVRSQPAFADVMLIALTGWGQAEDRARSHDAGFDHHLVKPVDVDVLEEVLRLWTRTSSAPVSSGERASSSVAATTGKAEAWDR
jgi:CheY-like chemotaxis protein